MPLNKEDVEFLIRRNDKLKSTRILYEPLWEEIAEYEFPRRVGIGSYISPGQKQTTYLYDSTAIHAIELLAASMHGTITPSSSKWFSLKLRDDRLNKIKEVMDWLELCADRMYLAIHQSNYNSEIHEVYLDLGAFATACLLIEEKPLKVPGFNGLQFKSIQNSEYCIDEDAEGRVDTVFREFELSARAAYLKWGDSLGEGVKKYTEKDQDQDHKFKFLHAVMPSGDGTNARPFVSYYVSLEDRNLLSEKSYWEFPYMVPRWSKSSGETYGRGQGHTALPDVKTLNKAKEFGLKAWAKDLDPPTFEKDRGVISSLKLYPGGRNVVRDKDSVWMMDHHIRYDVSQIKEEELRQSIRQIFYADQLKLQEGPEMTATEVQVRYELMQRLLGPTIGRLESELLNPKIERIFSIMLRASSSKFEVLPPPPAILSKMGIKEIDIEYEGPLAKAQRMSEMAGARNLFAVGAEITQVNPEANVFDNLDSDEVFRGMAEVSGAPSKYLRSVEEVAKIREARLQAQQVEQQKMDMQRMAEGAGRAAPALKAMQEASSGGKGAAS
jgi:hypothetical protein